MQRREFHKGAAAAAVSTLLGLAGCGGGNAGDPFATQAGSAQDLAAKPRPVTPAAALDSSGPLKPMGTNFSGMEWALGELRESPRTRPNIDYAPPRAVDVAYLAANGFGRNRLPLQWELLQPMLVDTVANAQARTVIGEPGALHPVYAVYIDATLDAHAAVGARCILDLHNFCRYKDFVYQSDGSVIGLTRPDDPLAYAYTTDKAQVRERIFALAPNASLTPAAFADVWRRMALRWKDHPGFGGYGLMNEPHDLPRPGEVTESVNTRGEDLRIWPAFARAAIEAIRVVDPQGRIYLAGNAWGGAMTLTPEYNPAWPLAYDHLVYEVHAYLDAYNNGAGFDWDLEAAKDYTALFGQGPITADTGMNRMKIAVEWARTHGARLALTETGMPIDDLRWQEAFRRLVNLCVSQGVEIQTWMGGSHWAARNHATNHAPGWHQNRTLEPLVAGPLKAAAGIAQAMLFDDVVTVATGGAVQIAVYARGHLAQPVTLQVASDAGGSLSKTTLVIPAGANGEDGFTFTPAPDSVATLTYTSDWPGQQLPPARTIYALADPVARAATQPREAGLTLIARYRACKWDLADGHTDFMLGRPADEGDVVRAVADSGWGSSPGNAMEMLNWMNQDGPDRGPLKPATMRTGGGRKRADFSAPGCTGLWCKKVIPGPTFRKPRNRVPYNLADSHFVIAVVSVSRPEQAGTVFHAGTTGGYWFSELAFFKGLPQARWEDTRGAPAYLTCPDPPALGVPLVMSLVCAPGRQALRVNSRVIAAGAVTLEPAPFENLMIGWGVRGRNPQPSFGGEVYGVIAGAGTPTDAEIAVMERYLLDFAGTP